MNRRILGFATALFLATGVAAAPAAAQGTQIGAKGGVHWANLTEDVDFDGLAESSSRMGWAAGGFLSFGISPMFAIQPELLWTSKGVSFDGTGAFADAEGDLELTYAEIPLLARLNFGVPMTGLRPYVMAGPYAAFELTCEFEAEFEGVTTTEDCDEEGADSDRNSTLFGIAAAAGLEFPLADLASVLIEGRFEQDLTSVSDGEGDGADGTDPKNRLFGVYFGLSVPLSGVGAY